MGQPDLVKQHMGRHRVTANVMAGQLERCLEAGMDDFLAKPLDFHRLRDVLDRFGLARDRLCRDK